MSMICAYNNATNFTTVRRSGAYEGSTVPVKGYQIVTTTGAGAAGGNIASGTATMVCIQK